MEPTPPFKTNVKDWDEVRRALEAIKRAIEQLTAAITALEP